MYNLSEVLGKALKATWLFLIILSVGSASLKDLSWIEAYLDIDWSLLAVEVLLLILLAIIGSFLYKLHPGIMGFGLFRIFRVLTGGEQHYNDDGTPEIEGKNFSLFGTDIRFLGIIIVLLLLTGIPKFAAAEEEIFRQGTTGWLDAAVRSLLFGFTHMIVGVPVFAVLMISMAGMFFSHLYFIGGLELSTQGHFQYNLIILFPLLIIVTISSLLPKRE